MDWLLAQQPRIERQLARTYLGPERNPALAAKRAHKRTDLLTATEEKVFKTLKTRDLGIRPIRHYTEDRTRSQVFLCRLAAHLTWHLRTAWAPTVPRSPAAALQGHHLATGPPPPATKTC